MIAVDGTVDYFSQRLYANFENEYVAEVELGCDQHGSTTDMSFVDELPMSKNRDFSDV